jgi:fatty acid desaturase
MKQQKKFIEMLIKLISVIWIMLVICFFTNIHAFNRFAQLIHGSDHGWLFKNTNVNSFWGNLAATFIGFTRAGHQTSHQLHHLYLNTELDSDRIWGAPDENINIFLRGILFDFCGISALKRLMQYSQTDKKKYTNKPWENYGMNGLLKSVKVLYPVIFTQIAIISYYSSLIGFKYYLILYVLPLCTFYPAFIRLRSLVEHSYEKSTIDHVNNEKKPIWWHARTVKASIIERFIFAPLEIPYHFEHHIFPGVPYYNLHKLNRLLAEYKLNIPTAPSYFGFLQQKIKLENV